MVVHISPRKGRPPPEVGCWIWKIFGRLLLIYFLNSDLLLATVSRFGALVHLVVSVRSNHGTTTADIHTHILLSDHERTNGGARLDC